MPVVLSRPPVISVGAGSPHTLHLCNLISQEGRGGGLLKNVVHLVFWREGRREGESSFLSLCKCINPYTAAVTYVESSKQLALTRKCI